MGGRAFGRVMPRLDRATYARVCDRLVTYLQTYYRQVEVPRCLPTKESFGDVDLLVAGPVKAFDPKQHAGSSDVVRNGNVMSFEFEGFQVDLLQYGEVTDMKRFFSDFGDMGMILGVMASRYGMRLSPRGLHIILPCDRKLLLSDDLDSLFRLFDMEPRTWHAGFQNPAEVNDFLASCCLSSAFLKVTTRHMRRAGVVAFVEHLASTRQVPVEEGLFRQRAIDFFQKRSEVAAVEEETARRAELKHKFNGKLVMQWTGATGRDVGLLMSQIAKEVPPEAMADMSPAEIRQTVLDVTDSFLAGGGR